MIWIRGVRGLLVTGTWGVPRVEYLHSLQPAIEMGHDAKLKSMILKIERGEMDMNELPDIAQELVGFKKGEKETVKGKDGKTMETTQYMICTKAPVRFQG